MNHQIAASDVSAAVRSAFNFTVDKFPLFGPDNMPTDQYGLFRSDTGYIDGIKSISDRYVPHSTDDVCALVEAASEAFDGEIECKTHFARGHYVSVTPTEAQRRAIYRTNDNIFPRIMIRGGFDGKGFQAQMGYYRDACNNLAMMRKVAGCVRSIRHTSGLRGKMDDLIATFESLKDGWKNLVEVAERMESRSVLLDEFVSATFADRMPTVEQLAVVASGEKCRKVTNWEKMTRTIMDRVIDERDRTGRPRFVSGEAKTVSAWEAFNAVQGYIQHASQSKTGFKDEFSKILRAAHSSHVAKAEELALAV